MRTDHPSFFLFGDLLSEAPGARVRRRLLEALQRRQVGVEARRFWPEHEGGPGRAISLSDGVRSWEVQSSVDPRELASIEKAVCSTVAAGSPVLALADADVHAGSLIRAWIPEAGEIHFIDPAAPLPVDDLTRSLSGVPRPSPMDLVFLAPLLGPSGYAAASRAVFRALEERPELRVCLRPLRFGREESDEDHAEILRIKEAAERRPGPDYVALHFVFPTQFKPDPDAKLNILRTMYETDGVPESWLPGLEAADEIWVPSAFHVRSFAARGIDRRRLRVIPEAVDTRVHDPRLFEGHRDPARPPVFLAVFDWSERKAPDILARSFATVFRRGEAVLRIKIHSSLGRPLGELVRRFQGWMLEAARRAGHEAPELEVLPPLCAPSRMPGIYAGADALVHASRGEGFGRPVAEAMAMGLPVIATTFGGTQDLLGGRGVGYPVAGRLVPCSAAALAEVPELAGHRWLAPDGEDLGRRLREVARDLAGARITGQRGRRHVERCHGLERCGRLAVRALREARCPRPEPTRGRPLLVLEGPVFDSSSYGGITRSLARALTRRGRVDVRLRPSGDPTRDPKEDADLLPLLEPPGRRPDHWLRSGWPVLQAPPDAEQWIQRIDWEYGAPPTRLVDLLSHGPDRILLHSEHVREGLLNAGIRAERIWMIPHGIDPARFRPGLEPLPEIRRIAGERCAFLFVGGAIWRKGVDVLLQAWLRAFRADDPVCLLMRVSGERSAYAGQGILGALRQASNHTRAPLIHLIEEDLRDDEISRLFASADVLVHPYRGEGFCLPVLEARAVGLPVIVSSGGATDEFIGKGGFLGVKAPRVAVELDERCTGRPGVLDPDPAALVQALRTAVAERATLASEALAVAAEVRRTRTWDRAAAELESRLCLPAGRSRVLLPPRSADQDSLRRASPAPTA
ncbi:MAG: glycosyltransferase family 4 protein [Planctomycetota bacterium]